jgi:hypothetical protein
MVQAVTRALVLELALAVTGPVLGQTLTCETRGDIRHCFDHHCYLSAEDRGAGGYTHGWDNQGRAWTTWEHDGGPPRGRLVEVGCEVLAKVTAT